MEDRRSRIMVICPVHNEADNVSYFFDRLKRVFDSIDPSRYECRLLFTNNRSTDETLSRIIKLESEYDWVDHVTLSRNFGYQLSVLSGITLGDGDLFMICDVDCEDPPEMLQEFLKEIEKGSDIVYGIRNNRPDSWLMRKTRAAFYLALRQLGDYTIVPYMAEFAMFKRSVRDVIINNSNSFPFIRAEIGYAGFNIVGVPYRRGTRRHGKSHYNYLGNMKFAVAAILSSSTFPLRAMLYMLPAMAFANVMVGSLFALERVTFQTALMGLVVMNSVYMMAGLGCLGIYLARTYQNALGRRRFIVDETQSSLKPCGGCLDETRDWEG